MLDGCNWRTTSELSQDRDSKIVTARSSPPDTNNLVKSEEYKVILGHPIISHYLSSPHQLFKQNLNWQEAEQNRPDKDDEDGISCLLWTICVLFPTEVRIS